MFKQIQALELQKHDLEQPQYDKKLELLITENKEFILFSVNGTKVSIRKDLTVQVTFLPCQHKQQLPMKDFLRNPNNPNSKSLFERWIDMIRNNITYSGALNCQECRKNKEKRFAKFRRYDDKPIGRASWTLRKLQ